MEFNKKLQELRKQKGLTQEDLANALFVSRTAISKWESGRGYPNLDSLKSIANFFGVSIDELLSNGELFALAQEETKTTKTHTRDLIFGLLDLGKITLFFLPLFADKQNGIIKEVSLTSLATISPYLKTCYIALTVLCAVFGVLILALQNVKNTFWIKTKTATSLTLSAVMLMLFILSQQPYAAIFLFLFLIIKALILIKQK